MSVQARRVASFGATADGRTLRALLLLSLLCTLGLTAVPVAAADPAAVPTPITTGVPRFEVGPCSYTLPKGQVAGQTVICGNVVVAEKHANPGGKTIKLPVALFKSIGASPAPEVTINLTGGPGQSGQVIVGGMATDGPIYKGLAANNDVIAFDQRGTGKSEPALQCPTATSQGKAPTNVLQIFTDSPNVQRLDQCRDQLMAQGVDLSAYNTSENAADVNDIRLALGYPAMNLVGVSYGSELGMAVVRDYSQFVRSSAINSIVPPQTPFYFEFPKSFSGALNALFADCAANPQCNAAYPDLKGAYQRTVAALDAKPITLLDQPLTGKDYTAILGQFFYNTELLIFMPDMLTRGSRGDFVWLQNLATLVLGGEDSDPLALGMHYSVVCSHNPTQAQLDTALADPSILPEVLAANTQSARDYLAICATWPSRNSDPKATLPPTGGRPTVLISGQFDPITPPAYADIVKQSYAGAVSVTLAGGGHSAIFPGLPNTDCGFAIVLSNIANPGKPDLACAATLKAIYAALPPQIAGPAASPSPSASPSASPTPRPSPSPTPSTSPIPSPPPTGNGGYLPGLPNTGDGGMSGGAGRTMPVWLVIVPFLALGACLVPAFRRGRRANR